MNLKNLHNNRIFFFSVIATLCLGGTIVAFLAAALPANTHATQTATTGIFMTVDNIQGSVTQAGKEGTIQVYQYSHNLYIPTDPQTGQLTGTRKHSPVVIIKGIDRSSPLLANAVAQGTTINVITINWYRIDSEGAEENFYRVELESVKVIGFRTFVSSNNAQEEISFRYNTITITWLDGGIKFTDTWVEPPS